VQAASRAVNNGAALIAIIRLIEAMKNAPNFNDLRQGMTDARTRKWFSRTIGVNI
jgi:hypothetical protein